MSVRDPLLLMAFLPLAALLAMMVRVRARRTRHLESYLAADPREGPWPRPTPTPTTRGFWLARGACLVGGGGALFLALSGFSAGTREVRVLESPTHLVLMVDISGSMAVEDVPPNRLESARLLVRRITHRLPGTAVGLTAFATDSHPLLPPGRDRDLLLTYLDALDPGMITNQGTNLLSPLASATRTIRESRAGAGTVFLLFSDGEDPGDPGGLRAKAESLRREGGSLATVALGTRNGGTVPTTAGVPTLRTRKREETLAPAIPPPVSRSDPKLLRELAQAGGGVFASAADPASVESLITWLEGRVGAQDTGEAGHERADRWAGLVALSFLLLVVEASFRDPLVRSLGTPWREGTSP